MTPFIIVQISDITQVVISFASYANSAKCTSSICTYNRVFSNFVIITGSKGKARILLNLLLILIKALLLLFLFLNLFVASLTTFRV